jgi:hypothetical protein
LRSIFDVEVAMRFDPVLVDLDGKGAYETQRALLVGKDADDMGTAFDLELTPVIRPLRFLPLRILST